MDDFLHFLGEEYLWIFKKMQAVNDDLIMYSLFIYNNHLCNKSRFKEFFLPKRVKFDLEEDRLAALLERTNSHEHSHC